MHAHTHTRLAYVRTCVRTLSAYSINCTCAGVADDGGSSDDDDDDDTHTLRNRT